MSYRTIAVVILGLTFFAPQPAAAADRARDLYTRALARERAVRDAEEPATVRQIRAVVAAYEAIVRRYPASGYCDNALWQAGNLALLAYQRFGDQADKATGVRLLTQLKAGYPSSSLVERVDETLASFENVTTERGTPEVARTPAPKGAPPPVPTSGEAVGKPNAAAPHASDLVAIRGITRTALPDGVRVSIEMDAELPFHQERLDNPRRVFFDLRGARPVQSLLDADLKFGGEPVPEIRLGRHPQNTTRVVMDMTGADRYSVFTLYNPYRLIVDFHREGATAPLPPLTPLPRPPVAAPRLSAPDPVVKSGAGPSVDVKRPPAPVKGPPEDGPSAKALEKAPLPSRAAAPPELSAPAIPSTNSTGQFSIARQLGLGVSRIVIDAGHGGHDPGARGSGLNEADLVLDVAQRLRKLLEAQPGVEVVMTRETDVFIPLEERTAIANRSGADLFLSIHANASRNARASGIETYFLNFASNPQAEAVAARENSGSGRSMHSLPDIVRAITLNNKIDESRDFAEMVQKSMVRRLSPKNTLLRDLGVKQAPFVVLIGAGMPSVLAEISFITHRQEGQLLKTPVYRQQIAEALMDAVVQYQKSLKAKNVIAAREE
jgi:N-acetylmuramoyl-L-alanine amidase